MARQVLIMPRATRDINSALDWLAQHSIQAADRWHVALLDKIQTLEDHAERCALAAEAGDVGVELRELLVGKRRNVYRVLFIIAGDVVHVLHVRHAARDRLEREDLGG